MKIPISKLLDILNLIPKEIKNEFNKTFHISDNNTKEIICFELSGICIWLSLRYDTKQNKFISSRLMYDPMTIKSIKLNELNEIINTFVIDDKMCYMID